METTQIMSNHATYRMLLVGKWDVFDYISAGCPYTVSWCRLIGRWSCWAIGFLMPSHIIPRNNSSVWHSLLQVVHLWKIQNKKQKMLENLHRCDMMRSFCICSLSERVLPTQPQLAPRSRLKIPRPWSGSLGSFHKKSPSTMMIYDL